jgi:hypothetical protein
VIVDPLKKALERGKTGGLVNAVACQHEKSGYLGASNVPPADLKQLIAGSSWSRE